LLLGVVVGRTRFVFLVTGDRWLARALHTAALLDCLRPEKRLELALEQALWASQLLLDSSMAAIQALDV
jgi:hypothetical protein